MRPCGSMPGRFCRVRTCRYLFMASLASGPSGCGSTDTDELETGVCRGSGGSGPDPSAVLVLPVTDGAAFEAG